MDFKFPDLVTDKVLHFVAGALIASIVFLITREPWYGFGAALMVGGYKEFFDHRRMPSVSKKYALHSYLDWLFTILGGLFIELIF